MYTGHVVRSHLHSSSRRSPRRNQMTSVQIRYLATVVLACAVVLAGCGGAPAAQEPAAQEPAATEGGATAAEIPNVEFTHQVVRYNTIADYEAATGNKITSFQQSPM